MAESGKAVFLSYAHEDAAAAQRIAEALRAAGVEVWFDQSELRGGDAWDRKLKKQIKECTLFVPVISANTQARTEGYFRREWKMAVDRTHDIADDIPFLVPVVIDGTSDVEAKVPDKFREMQWSRLPMAESGGPAAVDGFRAQVRGLLGYEVAVAGVVDPGDPASARSAGSGQAKPATVLSVLPVGLPASTKSYRQIKPIAAPRRGTGFAIMISAVISAAAAVAATAWWLRRDVTAPLAPRADHFVETLPVRLVASTATRLLTISPDGRTIIFVGRSPNGQGLLFRRDLGQSRAEPIPGTELAVQPFISADGKSVGYTVGDDVKRIALAGGSSVIIRGVEALVPAGGGGTWGRNDLIVVGGRGGRGNGLWQIPATGGTAKEITKLADLAGSSFHRSPALLPNGEVLFTAWPQSGLLEEAQLAVGSLKTGGSRMIGVSGSSPTYVSTGHIVFAQSNSLWAVPFDATRLEIVGDPVTVLGNVRVGANGVAQYALADNGTLVYLEPSAPVAPQRRKLGWLNREGKRIGDAGVESGNLEHPELSPDDTQVAYVAVKSATDSNQEVWVYNFASATQTLLSTSPAVDAKPVWSPDGREVAFASSGRGTVLRPANAVAPEQVMPNTIADLVSDWSRDNKYLLFDRSQDLYYFEQTKEGWGPVPRTFLNNAYSKYVAKLSPNGRFVLYVSTEAGRQELYVQDFPAGKDKWTLSNNGGTRPRWSDDGSQIYYVEGGQRLVAVDVKTEGEFAILGRKTLFTWPGLALGVQDTPSWDVDRKGERFLVLEQVAEAAAPVSAAEAIARAAATAIQQLDSIHIVLNWTDQLKNLAPAKK